VSGLAEHVGLRRLASLVAGGAAPSEVFAAIAREAGEALGAQRIDVRRLDGEGIVTVGTWGAEPSGPPEVSAPIVVDGRPWGEIGARWTTASELAEFAELVAAVISTIAMREELARMADEQAALRRVALLVTRGAPSAEVLESVAEEIGRLLRVASTGIARFEPDGMITVVAAWGLVSDILSVGARLPVGGMNVISHIARTGEPIRIDFADRVSGAIADHARGLGIREAIGGPIVVAGRLWGAMIASAVEGEPLLPDAESRLFQFTELVATAIANTEARTEMQRLADQQATLRRVATLVARGAAPGEVFDAVVAEVGQLFGAAYVSLQRAEGPDELVILSALGHEPDLVRAGMRLKLDGDSAMARVLRTGRSARLDIDGTWSGSVAEIARKADASAAIAAPIVVDGRLWGVLAASWRRGHDRAPADAEERLAEFAELVATAIANADSRDQLAASRARVLSAGDEARRRLVRDLHDGAQQRLVHSVINLKLAQRALGSDADRAESLLADALAHVEQGNAELRELADGIMPSVLTRGGLAGRGRLARRAARSSGRRGGDRDAPAAGHRGERVLHRR
jgi:GAF domain-containing protein